MLSVLLSPTVTPADKVEIMEAEYEIPMERKINEELNQMCNLSNYVEEIGIKKGIIQKRLQKGKWLQEIAEEMGEEEDNIVYIYNCVKQNATLSYDEILGKLNI